MDGKGDAMLNNGSCDSLPLESELHVQGIEETISEDSKTKINGILKEVDSLSPIEKVLLYCKLPTENSIVDPLKQPTNPLGSRSEINLSIQWIRTHLEEDPEISLQKKNVYDEYTAYCTENRIKPLSTADFGKVMKQVYPKVRPRRLGTRGHSQYCYSGLRTRIKLLTPALPDLSQKPQSTEFTISNDSDLYNATWCIVKEWSETKLGSKFNSLYNLAHYLVKNLAVGVGTDAATVIISPLQNEQNGDLLNAVTSNRHKETIRKIQLKCEGKEQKRKLQAQQSRSESRPRSKKAKHNQTPPSSRTSSRGPSPISSSSSATPVVTENKHPSPSHGSKSVCDKALDFRNGAPPKLPDIPVFPGADTAPSGKIPIPRLPIAQKQLQSPPPIAKNSKYKHIQPKCDNTAYNPHHHVENRSQEIGKCRRLNKREETVTASLLDDDTSELLSRRRLISVANLDKDALDEYLDKNNSQENEEMLRYYQNAIEDEDSVKSVQLSQLRSLLEQTQDNNANIKSSFKPMETQVVLPSFNSNLSARRRVSFDPQYPEDVPPSPNTRTKNYSFMPISEGSKSPGRQSCSSATPSPFVSPRNTPVPRARGNSHPYLPSTPLNKKKRCEMSQINLPMSAPPSPKVAFNNAQLFHYNTEFKTSVQSNDQLAAEVSSLLDSIPQTNEHTLMRSQSVPVHNFSLFQENLNELHFPEEKMNDIIGTLEQNLLPEAYDSVNISNYPELTFARRQTLPAESIDTSFLKLNNNPSRSVPSTPIPHLEQAVLKQEVANYSSRSYPSTPLTNETFKYQTQDYLLNGQPIKEKLEELPMDLMQMEPKPDIDIFNDPNLNLVDNKNNFDFTQLEDAGFAAKQAEISQEFEVMTNDYFKNVQDGT